MKVKDLARELTQFNPEAEVIVIVGSTSVPYQFIWGGGGDGAERHEVLHVGFIVDADSDSEG